MRFGQKLRSDADYFNSEVALNEMHRAGVSDTATTSSVSDSASSVTLLSANVDRVGFFIFNDSTEIAYVKFGATASSTDFTIRLTPNGIYESGVPVYRGRIDCIWASNAAGSMRITEMS